MSDLVDVVIKVRVEVPRNPDPEALYDAEEYLRGVLDRTGTSVPAEIRSYEFVLSSVVNDD